MDQPDRAIQIKDNARAFQRMKSAQAPFVVLKQPPLHRHARSALDNLVPNQRTYPWQYGNSRTEATELYFKGPVPLLEATCYLTHRTFIREEVKNQPKDSTSIGLANAMASQWTQTLLSHQKTAASNEQRPTAIDMVAKAKSVPPWITGASLPKPAHNDTVREHEDESTWTSPTHGNYLQKHRSFQSCP
jgi:hypothetical protein